MSAAARGAAGWLVVSGRMDRRREERRAQEEAERAAEFLKRQRELAEANQISTADESARRK